MKCIRNEDDELEWDEDLTEEEQAADERAMEAFEWAAKSGDIKICASMLAAGHDPNCFDDEFSPLMLAASEGHAQVCKLLLDHGADANYTNNGYWTALFAAAEHGHVDACAFLLAAGADMNFRERQMGFDALRAAVDMSHTDVVKLLLSHGADVGDSFHLAVLLGCNEICEAMRPLLEVRSDDAGGRA